MPGVVHLSEEEWSALVASGSVEDFPPDEDELEPFVVWSEQ